MFEPVVVEAMAPGAQLAQALLSVEPAHLEHRQALCWLHAWERQQAHEEACRYAVLARYGDLNPPEAPGSDVMGRPGEEGAVHPGGDGTPAMTEFAIPEVAVAMRCSQGRAEDSVGDGLDLRHRMPQLFSRLRAGQVPAYKVRMILRAARALSLLAARLFDERIAPIADKVGPKRLEREIERLLVETDPAEADRRAKAAQATRRIDVLTDRHGDRRILGYVDAFAGMAFDAALSLVADILRDLGDNRPRDARRAAAVGWLANPTAALALVQRHRAWKAGDAPLPLPTSTIRTVTDDDGSTHLRPGLWPLDLPTPHDLIDKDLWPSATVVVHFDAQTWQQTGATGPVDGAAEVAGHGPITATQASEWLRHSRVTIKPVIDLNDDVVWISDDDEFRGGLREAVLLANGWNPFPYADTEAKDSDDFDHTLPRRLGGLTTLDNGGPLRRRQHRLKTFAKGWRVKQPVAGLFCWETPEGRVYVLDRRGYTHHLGFGQSG